MIGARNNHFKPGGQVTKNIKDNNDKGQLWAVNSKIPDVLGLPTYQTIDELPGTPDLAIIAIPAKFVLPALQDIAKKGIATVIIMTTGFGDKDDDGKAMEQASKRGLSFGTVINLGNLIQLGVEDLLQMYDQNYSPENSHILYALHGNGQKT